MNATSRVRPMLHEVTCQECGLLGTGARATPQEATKTVVEGKKSSGAGVRGNKCRQNGKHIKQNDSVEGKEEESLALHNLKESKCFIE